MTDNDDRKNLIFIRDFIFGRIIGLFTYGDGTITFKYFRKATRSKDKRERKIFAETELEEKTVFLDAKYLNREIDTNVITALIHEASHLLYDESLDDEATSLFESKRAKDSWQENQISNFEKHFFNCLSDRQIETLKFLIEEARRNFKKRRP